MSYKVWISDVVFEQLGLDLVEWGEPDAEGFYTPTIRRTERYGTPLQTHNGRDPESWEGLLLLKPRDEFDGAIVGRVERFNQTFIVYSRRKVLEIVAADIASAGLDDDQDPMEAALDHYGFNMNGGWYGEGTWGFLIDDED